MKLPKNGMLGLFVLNQALIKRHLFLYDITKLQCKQYNIYHETKAISAAYSIKNLL